MAISNFLRKKKIDVTNVSGTPTISRTMCLKITGSDDSVTGTGEIVLDWSNIASKADIGVYDESNNLLDYYFETFDETEEKAVIWVFRDWVQDGSTQLQLGYGDGPSDQSAADPSTVFSNETDLEAGYLFNETSGDLIDVSGNGNHGTVYGATQGEDGLVGKMYSLDGSDDYIDISTISLTGDFTILSLLVNPAYGSPYDYNMYMGSRATEDFISLYDDNTFKLAIGGDATRLDWSIDSYTDKTQSFTVTRNSETIELFVDDVSQGTKSNSEDLTIDEIGTAYSSDYHYEGGFDLNLIYNSAFEASEIAAFRSATKSSPDFFSQQAGEDIVVGIDAATNVTSTSATLHGTLKSLSGESSLDVWFDYSTDDSFSSYDSTSAQTLSETGSFSDDVSGLTALETYYVRAAATDGTNTWYGGTKSFIATDFEYVEDEGGDFETGTLTDVEVVDDKLQSRQQLRFDGDDDYVSRAGFLKSVASSNFTLSWTGSKSVAETAYLTSENTGLHYKVCKLYVESDGKISWTQVTNDGPYETKSTAADTFLFDGEEHTITVAKSTTELKIYLDKSLVLDTSPAHNEDGIGDPDFRIGRDRDGYGAFDCVDVKAWEVMLSESDVYANVDDLSSPPSETDLLVWYTFTSGSGSTLYDQSGNDRDGTIYGAAWIYLSFGTRTTPEIDISTLSAVENSLVQWTSDEPTDTSIIIEAAISEDGGSTWGSWQTCTDGNAVPGLADADMSNARIKFKQTLETTDETETPKLSKFEFYIAEGTSGIDLTADILGVSYTQDISATLARNLVAAIQAQSTAANISPTTTVTRELTASISAASAATEIQPALSRNFSASIAAQSTTQNIAVSLSRHLASSIAAISTTADITPDAIAASLIADIEVSSTTPDISATLTRHVAADIHAVSSTSGIVADRRLSAQIQAESQTADLSATILRTLTASISAASQTASITADLTRHLTASIQAASTAADITPDASSGVNLLADIAAASTTADATITRRLAASIQAHSLYTIVSAQTEVSGTRLQAQIQAVSATSDIHPGVLRFLTASIAAQSTTSDLTFDVSPAMTQTPTGITAKSATLNGLCASMEGNSSLTAWFEYSLDSEFSNPTKVGSQLVTSPGAFSYNLTGLDFASHVYYRAVLYDGSSTWQGEIEDFWTADLEVVDDLSTGTLDGLVLRGGNLELEAKSPGMAYTEDFEDGFGDWVQGEGNDEDWTRKSGSTGSSNTGPSGAYEGSYYIYVETSDTDSDDESILVYEGLDEYRGIKVSFAYHMYGSDTGTLHLEALVGGEWESVWSKSGNQGDEWFYAEVDVPECTAVRFRYITDNASGYQGDAALDAITVEASPIYADLGVRVSPQRDISDISAIADSYFHALASIPDDTSLSLEMRYSMDSGSTWSEWKVVDDMSELERGVYPGSGGLFQSRQTFIPNEDKSETPSLEDFRALLQGGAVFTASVQAVSQTSLVTARVYPLYASVLAVSLTSDITPLYFRNLKADIAATSTTSSFFPAMELDQTLPAFSCEIEAIQELVDATLPAFTAQISMVPTIKADLELEPGWIGAEIKAEVCIGEMNAALPGMTAEITLHPDLDIQLPGMQADIEAATACEFDITLPAIQAEIASGMSLDIQLPAMTAEIVPKMGNIASFDISLPGFSCEVTSNVTKLAAIDISLPGMDAEVAAIQGWQADLDISLPGLEVTFDVTHNVQPSTLNLDVNLPGVESTITSTIETIAYLDATLPAIVVSEGRIQIGNVAQQTDDIYLHHKRYPEWQSWY